MITGFYIKATMALNRLSFTVYRQNLLWKALSFEVKIKDTTTFWEQNQSLVWR